METIDIRGIPKEKVDYLLQLITLWREEEEIGEDIKGEEDNIIFTTQKSKVLGSLTRREIYDQI